MKKFKYDLFISATEQSHSFTLPLVEALRKAGIRVWFDKFEVKAGYNLFELIKKANEESRFALVILSQDRLQNKTPYIEFVDDIIFETYDSHRIIPICHQVGFREVRESLPFLVDNVAIHSDSDKSSIVRQIQDILKRDQEGRKKTKGGGSQDH